MPAVETAFTALRIEGGLLPAEFLQHIAAFEAPGQSAADYGIPPGLTLRDEIGRYWHIAEALWKDYRQNWKRTDVPAERTGVERWLSRLLRDVLGYSDLSPAPRQAIGDRLFPITHQACAGAVPLLLTTAPFDLDQSYIGFGDSGRRRAPHAALQELLNADPAVMWGLLSNGPKFRLLRDNPSLTRPAYIEADLERIFEERLYPDFAACWLLAHASRLAPGAGGMAGARIEQWRLEGTKTGERALARLRIGVTTALRELGSGFVEHPDNEGLRTRLNTGAISADDFHQQLLRMVYRLLFLFTAEERDLLHDQNADADARELYGQGYSLGRLRDRSRFRRYYDRYSDLWAGLRITFRGLARGVSELGLPALGGLFREDQCATLDQAVLPNPRLLSAIHALTFFTSDGSLQRVNYRDMGTEELGSVYESLLELHPIVHVATRPWTFGFAGDEGQAGDARATERRLSGSYYTPDVLVQEVLRTSLDPLIAQTLSRNTNNPRQALLSLRIIDPACGSGHFLLGAARRLADAIARLDMEGDMPDEGQRRHALRDVVRRCIYGVDRNPLSVELCRTALWIESLEPGKPLSFLEAHIRCGDALVGITDLRVLAQGIPDEAFVAFVGDEPAATTILRRMNRAHREMQPPSLELGVSVPTDLALALDALSLESDDTLETVERKRRRFEKLRSGETGWHLKIACDLWTAAFFAVKAQPEIRGRELCPTTDVLWRYLQGTTVYGPLLAEADRLAQRYRFFHWPLEFPDVMHEGGFDLIFGNPPWETTSPDAKEFFAAYDLQVRFMSNDDQKAAYARLKEHPTIATRWDEYCRDLYTQTNFYKESGRYLMFAPGNLGKGDLNVYRMFVETAISQSSPTGFIAQIAPDGLYNGANAAALRRALFEKCSLNWLLGFQNLERTWFPSIYYRMKFCIYSARKGEKTRNFKAAFGILSTADLDEAIYRAALSIPVNLVSEFSPDALAVMEFAAQSEIDTCRKMYSRYPKFGAAISDLPNRVYMAEVHMGSDRDIFSDDADGFPVFEGRMVDLYDYRAKSYSTGRGRSAEWLEFPFGDPRKAVVPQWRISNAQIPIKLHGRIRQYRIGFCDVASATNERSLVAALIPPSTICGDKVPTILFDQNDPAHLLLWLGVANSLVMDFIVRKKVALKMSYTIMDSLPFPRDWKKTPGAKAIIERAYALSAVGAEMETFRQTAPGTSGVRTGIDLVENPDDRAGLMAEIDVLVARDVYGLDYDDMRYVLDPDNILGQNSGVETFKALRNRERRQYGRYRTQDLVLDAWNRYSPDGGFRPKGGE